jgi:hypothetical protein
MFTPEEEEIQKTMPPGVVFGDFSHSGLLIRTQPDRPLIPSFYSDFELGQDIVMGSGLRKTLISCGFFP